MSQSTRLLLIEDDPVMGALVEKGLVGEGYDVTWVKTGMDGLIAAANGRFAVAAIDVMLPETTGFEVCRHLRRRGDMVPILLLTARDAVEDRVFGLDSGADDYLTKPFAFAELSARIRALVRRELASVKPTIQIGNIQLDTPAVRATNAGKVLPFSTKEFGLLRALATRKNQTVTRAEILQEVWGTTKHIDPTIVDQYVRYVRRKLDAIEPGFAITTVRGVGYELHETG